MRVLSLGALIRIRAAEAADADDDPAITLTNMVIDNAVTGHVEYRRNKADALLSLDQCVGSSDIYAGQYCEGQKYLQLGMKRRY